MKDRDEKGHFITGNKTAAKNRMDPPPDASGTVLKLASKGIAEISIARALGVSYPVFARWRNEYPELEEARKEGRGIEHDALFDVLFKSATVDRNITSAMFLLKARHGYREQGPDFEIQNKVAITFELPGAMQPTVYEAEVLKKVLPRRRLRMLTNGK